MTDANRATSRRAFLAKLASGLAVATPASLLAACSGDSPRSGAPALHGLSRKSGRVIAGDFVDNELATGHALRDGQLSLRAGRVERRRAAVAIVGGGMAGLSAGWRLDALGMRDWTLLELAPDAGGNSRSGENAITRFPWGAHYVPVPSHDAVHVRSLLREVGVLAADGTWDERVLCHAPQERLWKHGRWHEGLEPLDAVTNAEREQWDRFEEQVSAWRESGAFRVPLAGTPHLSFGDAARATAALDGMSARAWLDANGFTAPTLRWWVEYGTRDDYGGSLEQVSAWAAAHYFAARPSEEDGPLTWPEGNGFLVRYLAQRAADRLITNAPSFRIEQIGRRWLVRTPNLEVECDAVVWAAPLFVLPRVMPSVAPPVTMEYAPWVVANVVLDRRPAERSAPLAWDNVIYGSPSLGYVSATHQFLGRPGPETVWTWYHALVDQPAVAARRAMESRTWASWRDEIMGDLGRAHPDIAECVTRIDVKRWGHAMARPVPGVLARNEELSRWSPAPGVFVAHSDLSGFSLFEEAQWHGVQAAEAVVGRLGGGGGGLG